MKKLTALALLTLSGCALNWQDFAELSTPQGRLVLARFPNLDDTAYRVTLVQGWRKIPVVPPTRGDAERIGVIWSSDGRKILVLACHHFVPGAPRSFDLSTGRDLSAAEQLELLRRRLPIEPGMSAAQTLTRLCQQQRALPGEIRPPGTL